MKPLARRIALTMLKTFNPGKIGIKHHHTGRKVVLDAYLHKGYWWHGLNREKETMEAFSRLIQPGDHVVEVGGHIGYISMFFSQLVGEKGQVTVFEPGENNLPYTRENLNGISNVVLEEKVISEVDGIVKFYTESLTGQNNSLNADFDAFQENSKNAYSNSQYKEIECTSIPLDRYADQADRKVDFLKIDVESAELTVLRSATKTIQESRPIVMVEVASGIENQNAIYEFFCSHDYLLYFPEGDSVTGSENLIGNLFCFPAENDQAVSQFHQQRLVA